MTDIRNRLAALVLIICTTFPAMAAFDAEHLSAVTEQGMEMWHVPGMAVAVVSQDEVLLQKGFGKTAAENGQAVDEHTLFAIASTTKAMVVAGILMLVDDGKLSLDDSVIKHIPELHLADPALTQQLIVRDLLAHRTGLPSTDIMSFLQGIPLHEQFTYLQKVPAIAPVRTRLIYQNTMYEIAGLLIERLSGQRWHEFLTERLWQPIGMLETYGERGQISAQQSYVTPHFYMEDKLSVPPWNMAADQANAAGSVWSSIYDMSLWAQFLLNDFVSKDGKRLVSEENVKQMFEPHQLSNIEDFYPTAELTQPNWRSYGLGWFQQDFQGRKIDFHTGSLSGLIAIIGLDRANDKAVIVLANRDHAEMRHALLWEVMDETEGDKRRDWNQDVFDLYARIANKNKQQWTETQKKRLKQTKPSLNQATYPGTYRSDSMGEIMIERSAGNMILKTAQIDFEMEHWHLDTFLVEYKDWGMHEFAVFNFGPDGKISSLKLFGNSFKRVAPSEPEGDISND